MKQRSACLAGGKQVIWNHIQCDPGMSHRGPLKGITSQSCALLYVLSVRCVAGMVLQNVGRRRPNKCSKEVTYHIPQHCY